MADPLADFYSPWSVEVEKGKSVKVALRTEFKWLKVTRISIGKDTTEDEENRPVYVYKTVYKKRKRGDPPFKRSRQLLATLYSKELRDSEMNLFMRNEDLELSHTWDNGSLFLHGEIADDSFDDSYKCPGEEIYKDLLYMSREDARRRLRKLKRRLEGKTDREKAEIIIAELKSMRARRKKSDAVRKDMRGQD